jgi:hypothetical protein
MPRPRVLAAIARFAAWLAGWPRTIAFRIKRARALRKARRDDPNNYPMW